MTATPPSPHSNQESNMDQCKHPRVQIVAREEDAEFVECMECGAIFESSEFKDMAIEDGTQASES
jgi:hypothetical protein